MKKILTKISVIAALVALVAALTVCSLYTRRRMNFNFDAAYYWTKNSFDDQTWHYEELVTGHKFYLYLPTEYKIDKDNEEAKIPLIVTFHGSGEKGSAIIKMGRPFITEDFQSKIYPEGAAVLVVLSRLDYFTDPASMSLLIQNVVLKNKCIDPDNIIAYGFSQGAKYAVELACHEPRLFKAVISGSGFYQISARELLSVLPVHFYSAISENDKGIFEQGNKTGKLCARFCKNSRYVQYEKRWHFWVELKDKTGRKNKDGSDETMQDWLIKVVNSK